MRLAYLLNPRKVVFVLGILALYFAIQSLVVEYLIENILDPDTHSALILVIDLFSVNAEETIPTWYATILLFIAAVLLSIIATGKYIQQDRYRRYWAGLAIVFLYLSIDEGAAIHEILSNIIEPMIEPTGYLYFAWLIAAVPLVIIFGILYLRFLLHLPPKIRNLIVLAGLLYVGGAIVVEAISANRWYLDSGQSFEYLAIATVEELAEMLGVTLFIYALLTYGLEMNYSTLLQLTPTSSGVDNPSAEAPYHNAGKTIQPSRHFLMAIFLILFGVNVILVIWSLGQSPESILVQQVDNQAIISHLETYNIHVEQLVGRFSPDNPLSQEVAPLLADYDEVMIINWAASDSSIAIAGHKLPFDQNSLSEILHLNDGIQFVIYNTNAIEAIVGNTEITKPQQ